MAHHRKGRKAASRAVRREGENNWETGKRWAPVSNAKYQPKKEQERSGLVAGPERKGAKRETDRENKLTEGWEGAK
jgi:hypothetical protein